MAQLQLDLLSFDNCEVAVLYDDLTGAVTSQQTNGTNVVPQGEPIRTYLVGDQMHEHRVGDDRWRVVATSSDPYAERQVDAGYYATTTCDLTLSVAVSSTVQGEVTLTVTSSNGPVSTKLDTTAQFVQGQTVYTDVPAGQRTAYATDAAGCTAEQGFYVPGVTTPPPTGGGGTPPARNGVKHDEFTDNNGVLHELYYDAAAAVGQQVTDYLTPATSGQVATVTEAERGRAAGEEVTAFCEGTTRVRLLASLGNPFLAVERTANSTACGYTPPPDPDPEPEPEPEPTPDPVPGACGDPDATNYTPGGTDNTVCSYGPRWRSLWPQLKVAVPTYAGNPDAYLSAEVWAGYPAGHPYAAQRPLSKVAELRATVSPVTGLAEFDLGPYLQPLLPRLDVSRPTSLTTDLLLGYEMRTRGVVWERGYAVNAAVPDAQHFTGKPLTPFAALPGWPGYPYDVAELATDATGKYGTIERVPAPVSHYLPCPQYPVPVTWLDAVGGYGYWVFGGRHAYGQQVPEGQGYSEAQTGERRLSSRPGARRTVAVSTGYFGGLELLRGLLTLRESVQAWAQLDGPDSEWTAVTVDAGDMTAWRAGQRRFEATVQLTAAAPRYVQGQ